MPQMAISSGNILIVDDEETIRFVLNRKLSKHGYQCDEAMDAEQALDKLNAKPPELVMLDINMPGKPGDELLPEIHEKFPGTAVIMASGVTDTRVIARCIKDGAQDYLHKPFKLDEVLLSVSMSLEKRRLEAQIREHQQHPRKSTKDRLRKAFLDAIQNLINDLEANDKYTAGHSQRVSETSLAIGQSLGLTPSEIDDLKWGALLHDVGKIAIDTSILNKPDRLTPEEYRYIMTHAIIGPNLIRPLANDQVVEIILYHHDHYNGSGLDQTLTGKDIPLGARIVAAADALDAMTSDRPYRAAMSQKQALEEMARFSGTQFDPQVTGTILKMFSSQTIPVSL
ncbi:HD domain-containing phosphohydrolase [Chloroflexota bacterium]